MYTRYGNPYMRRWTRMQSRGGMAVETTPSTYKGVVGKSIFMVLLTIGIAIVTEVALWLTIFKVAEGEVSADFLLSSLIILLIGAGVAGVVMLVGSIVMLFSPASAKVFGPIYCVCQGVFLGFMAGFMNIFLPGVSLAALLGTGIVFAMCLVLYKVLKVRIGNRFALGLVIGLISFLLVELICVPILYLVAEQTGNVLLILAVQAGVSFFCVLFATITVFWDIQNIDEMVRVGADKSFEWVLAFSLTSSLIYLYVEILELLVRLLALFTVKKDK